MKIRIISPFLLLMLFSIVLSAQKPDIEMISIPGGCFIMGTPESEPTRNESETLLQVTLQGFKMSKYEITNAQYCAFLNAHKQNEELVPRWINLSGNSVDEPNMIFYDYETSSYKVTPGFDLFPAVFVSWHGALAFAQWMGGTLPTEAQWEYACRADTKTPFNTGVCLSDEQANYNANHPYSNCEKGNFIGKVLAVGCYEPNAFGLYDMHGNVWEWCLDWYGDYHRVPQSNPSGPETGTHKVRRGGSWSVNAKSCRTAYRNICDPGFYFNDLGFRIVITE